MAFTFFFRDQSILDLIGQHAVPQMQGFGHVKIWDAGCAMGPEPFSLAMMIAERMGNFMFRNVRIDATDIDEQDQFCRTIQEGEYTDDLLKRIPTDIMEKYFEPGGKAGSHRLVASIRERVHFMKHDLLSLRSIGSGYHLIVCKNVLLHFSPESRVDVIRMFHASLASGGFLATEQAQKLPPEVAGLFSEVSAEGQLFQKGNK
jgi:chemotaxis protein methyltransferase CheR